jgi:hypothetical protein
MSMITHRVRPTNPTHETAHFAIDQGPKNQMVMIGHQLIAVQLNLVDLQAFMQNSFERGKVFFFAKNIRSQVSAIERVIKSACFVGSGCSRHVILLLKKAKP